VIIFSEIELDDDITLNNIQWLKNNSKPLSKIQELWRLTNKSRLRSLQKETTAVHDYMDMFPAVKNANGYLLVCIFMAMLTIFKRSWNIIKWNIFYGIYFMSLI